MKPCMMVNAWLLLVIGVLGADLRGVHAAAASGHIQGQIPDHIAGHPHNDLSYIHIHSWLMWSSMGFLFPLGAILIRYRRAQCDPTSMVSPAREQLLLYLHIIVQCAGVGAATSGIAILLKEIGAKFYHTHMKLGLALWIIVMVMPFMSIVRPVKGTRWRSYWFAVHWLFGTGTVILGIVNCFIGISIYQRFHGSIQSFNITFCIQVAIMALLYFLQDRLCYIVGQGSKASSKLPRKGGTYRNMETHVFATPMPTP